MAVNLSKIIEDAFGASSETASEIKFIREKLGNQADVLDKVILDLVKHKQLIDALAMRVREAEDLATTQRSKLATASTLTHHKNKAVLIANEINGCGRGTLAEAIGYMTDEKKRLILDLLNLTGEQNDSDN